MKADEIQKLNKEFKNCQKTLTAFNDEARQKLILLMVMGNREGVRVADLAEKSALSRPAISHHMQILKNAGIVKCRKQGKHIYYYFDPAARNINALLHLLEHIRDAIGAVQQTIDLLVTLNSGYLRQLCIMLTSALLSNPDVIFHVYVLHTSLSDEDLAEIHQLLPSPHVLSPIRIDNTDFSDAPTTGRYPTEMYYRIFAAQYLPEELDRILYLDPDIVVRGTLQGLYNTPMEGSLFAAASHVGTFMTHVNSLRLDSGYEKSPYINSGVMLLNLKRLRQEQNKQQVFAYIEEHKSRLILPDQDIISGLYGAEITLIDPCRYNMTERLFALHPEAKSWLNLDWVKEHAVIVHYCGRNKPWKPGYVGALGAFYQDAETVYEQLRTKAIPNSSPVKE